MSHPAGSQLLSYRRTNGEGLEMDPSDTYSQSRTLSANRGPVAPERTAYYPDLDGKREDDEGALESKSLLTPREKAILAVGGSDSVPVVQVIPVAEKSHRDAPIDRYSFVYFILLIHGFGTLLPWNVLISSWNYWNHKLDTTSCATNATAQEPRSTADFMNSMTLANQFPNVLLNAVNLFATFGGSLNVRIVSSISILILIMAETLILSALESCSWVGAFVVITLISVVVLGTANGIYQNSVYGLAASLPSKYTNSIIIGNNFCGVLVALMAIMCQFAFGSRQHEAGILFFACALAVLLLAFATYFMLPKSRFYRYYFPTTSVTAVSKKVPQQGFRSRWNELVSVLLQNKMQFWNVFFTFFVTLSVFPNVMLNVGMANPIATNDTQPWMNVNYFHPVATILNFNLFAFFGNLVPFACTQPGPGKVWIPVLMRVLFIPFFLFCNYNLMGYARFASVWFPYDAVYILGGVFLAITSGYFSSITMMYASSQIKDPRLAPIAGQLAGFFLVLGIFCGLMFSKVMPFFVMSPVPISDVITSTIGPAALQFVNETVGV